MTLIIGLIPVFFMSVPLWAAVRSSVGRYPEPWLVPWDLEARG